MSDQFSNLMQWYEAQISEGVLTKDPVQIVMIRAFQQVLDELNAHHDVAQKPPLFLKRLFTKDKKASAVRGLYVYGGVGRGKTMIMDQAFQLVQSSAKKRVHFNDFMLDVHRRLKELRKKASQEKGDPKFLETIADDIAREVKLLAFDEFQVRDIADAMLMKGLFSALFKAGVTIFATSNVAPDDLYKGGLQRQRFLPFIPVLKHYVDVLYLDSPTDYRLLAGQDSDQDLDVSDLYFTPMGSSTFKQLQRIYAKVVGKESVLSHSVELSLNGRQWTISPAVEGVACMVSFAECCEQPRAAEDYIGLAQKFGVVFLCDVPKMGYDRRNEAKRFILLIDTLYDQGVKLVISAEAQPDKLYYGQHHEFEFQRTISRLQEMRYYEL